MRELTIRTADDVLRVAARIEDPRPALGAIGEFLVSEAQRAFQEQRFGDVVWPERYPEQKEPFINVAAALVDLTEGPRPKRRRFDRRPAAFDKGYAGGLAGATSAQVVGLDTVEVGNAMEHASRMNFGGESSIAVTEAARDHLATWLATDEGKPYRERLGFLFSVPELVTRAHARPFLGVTRQAEADIVAIVEDFVAGEPEPGGGDGGA